MDDLDAFDDYAVAIESLPVMAPLPDGSLTHAQAMACDWIIKRQRPGMGGVPVRGFGPDGLYTLNLPHTGPTQAVRFVDGVPTMVDVPGAEIDPELEALRLQIREACRRVDTLVISVPFLILTCTARLLRVNYEFSDADLDLMLCGQKLWVEGVVRYLHGDRAGIHELIRSRPGEIGDTFLTLAMARQEADRKVATPPPSRLNGLVRRFTFRS